LLTDVGKEKAKGVKNPFVYVDMRAFLPPWCAKEVQADSDTEDDASNAAKELQRTLGLKTKAYKPHLNLSQWLAAYERYSLAAVMTGQWDLPTAMAPIAHILLPHCLPV
jgi:hypothetical protein